MWPHLPFNLSWPHSSHYCNSKEGKEEGELDTHYEHLSQPPYQVSIILGNRDTEGLQEVVADQRSFTIMLPNTCRSLINTIFFSTDEDVKSCPPCVVLMTRSCLGQHEVLTSQKGRRFEYLRASIFLGTNRWVPYSRRVFLWQKVWQLAGM